MIHDKDYILRIVRQLSAALAKIILDKNERKLIEFEGVFETQTNDVFKMDFEELLLKSTEEISDFVNQKEISQHADYYELLGNIFYLKGSEYDDKTFLNKAKTFYELYLQKSGIFSLVIISRINELE
ncbi:MAG: hypothetical protein LBE36_03870 [Flavobacteriaceae bacterium]|jgi:predicted house-cleaning noncanonical NTP pyrophosphatase (MazG superfamily)|nr:hypothetical protein [Flavobacteriaceae bacterium]